MSRKLQIGLLLAMVPMVLSAWNDGNWYGGLDALYWKTTHCPIHFATTERELDNFEALKAYHLKGDYDWGVRARLGYERCCMFADISYLWFEATDHVKVNRGGADELAIQGGEADLDFARSNLRFRYQNVDLRVGCALHRGDACNFQVYGDGRWIEIDFRNRTWGAGEEAFSLYQQGACLQAGGPGVGLMGDFTACNFTAGGRLGATAMIGRSRVDRTLRLDTDEDSENAGLAAFGRTCVTPGIDVDLHVGYSKQCRCTRVGVVVGYEMDYYFDALMFSTISLDDSEDLPIRTCQNIGFGGPYIGLRLNY